MRIAIAAIAMLLAMPAAAQTVDQSNATGGSFIFNNSATATPQSSGQSFTPTATSIQSAQFSIAAASTVNPATIYLRLYEGEGFDEAQLLYTSGGQTVPAGPNTTYNTYSFTFSPITLTPGNLYTLRIAPSAGAIRIAASTSNPYSGGSRFDSAGAIDTTDDLVFSEASHIGAAPEPTTWGLMMLGFGLIGAALRRKSARLALA